MDIKRREFLRMLLAAASAGGAAAVVKTLGAQQKEAIYASGKTRWAFLVDTNKCVGCGMCVRACKLENETPYDAPVTRTWVERYVVLRDGRVLADNPLGARDGYTKNDPQGQSVRSGDIKKAFFVPKLCNQCDKPPCVQVCPVGATYRTADGIVLVDRKWCIGCGYCIMGCPYGVRFFNPVHKVAEKCNWCYHRIHKGLEPACVFACPFGARKIGDFKNPDDPVTKTIMTERVSILKDEYGTKPMVFYLGLDENVK